MNIKFKSIKIQNFLSLGDVEFTLEDQGFVLVKGLNNETKIPQSNGSGKSSLFDAIFWTFNGETMRGASEVVNEHASDGAYCELTFECDSTSYKIIRTKSHSKYGNSVIIYQDESLISDMTKKSQEWIESTFPAVSSQILGSIVLLGQGLPYKFTNLPPSKRKDLLDSLSGSSSQIDFLKEQLEVKNREKTEEATSLQKEIDLSQGEVKGLTSLVETLKAQADSYTEEASSEEIQNRIDLLTVKCTEETEIANKISSTIESLNKVKDSTYLYLSNQGAEKTRLLEERSKIKSGICPVCNRPFEVDEEMMNHKEELETKLASIEDSIKILTEKYEDSFKKVNSFTREKEDHLNSIKTYELQISQLKVELKNLQDKETRLQEINGQIARTSETIKEKNKASRENEDKITDLREMIACISYLQREVSRDFKGFILKDIVDFISKRAEYYSEFLFTSSQKVKLEVSGNKILVLLDSRQYENLSGGEKQRVDLSVQFALRDMLMTTSGFSCNILVLDEAFDNLDSQGAESLVNLISSEFSDVDSVFTITHHSELGIPYDKTVLVTKDASGVSHLSEE